MCALRQSPSIALRQSPSIRLHQDRQLERIIQTQRDVAAASLDLDSVMQLICERTQELTDADGATVLLVDGDEFVHAAATGYLSTVVGERVPMDSLTGWVYRNNQPVICNEARSDDRVSPLAEERGIRAMVVVPLRRGENTIAMLAVASRKPDSFGEEDLQTLELLLVVLSAAMSHAAEFEAQQAKTEAFARYRAIFQGASIGIVRVEPTGHLVEVNPAMERMLGYSAAELASVSFAEYTHEDDVGHNLALFREMMAGESDSYQLEKRYYRKDGELIWTQVTAALERDTDGKPAFAISMIEDITQRKVAERELVRQAKLNEHQAFHDALTGLPNRRKLFVDMEQDLETLDRSATLGLGLFDLDGFKIYNDTFGHPAGDSLLARLGRRLARAIGTEGTAYRMGGDEFCIVVRSGDVDGALLRTSAALMEQGEWFSVRASYGSVVLPTEATTIERALQLADQRLYGSKRATRVEAGFQVRDALAQVIAEQSRDLARHGNKVAALAAATAAELGLSAEEIARTRLAAELHDIGKAALPEAILAKPGPLDDAEWEFVRRHTLIGERILAAAPALANIAPLVRSSHERPDGSGYPDGLSTEQIPLGARIVAVVDAFDAMVSGRAYKPPIPEADAILELQRCTGSQFDPEVVQAFLRLLDELSESNAA
jgi:diguanylate cyclase (GGDEF)-like protein/PAS domain S-box-containing protein